MKRKIGNLQLHDDIFHRNITGHIPDLIINPVIIKGMVEYAVQKGVKVHPRNGVIILKVGIKQKPAVVIKPLPVRCHAEKTCLFLTLQPVQRNIHEAHVHNDGIGCKAEKLRGF